MAFENYEDAFKKFNEIFFKDKKSIFTDKEIFNKNNVEFLIRNFVEKGDTSDKDFDEKIKEQLKDPSDDVIDLMANIIWLWRLPPKTADRKSSVAFFLKNFNKEELMHGDPNSFLGNFVGFATAGTYYNINKAFELAYIIRFLEKYLEIDGTEKEIYILKKELGNSIKINEKEKTASMYNALLHLFKPGYYMPIISNAHKESIVAAFESKYCKIDTGDDADDIDKKLEKIKDGLENDLKGKIELKEKNIFYDDSVKNMWSGGIYFESKNIILYGAPGTGKTYQTKQTIEARKLIEKNHEYKIVQFHPSYSYEDFMDGVKPTGIENEVMKFELKNGVFKQMCIDAFKDLEKNKEKAKRYYFVADEINRAELSRVFGELLLCLEEDKRLSFDKKGNLQGMLVKTANSSLWDNEKHAVYVDEAGEGYFGVPENLYFIGTMNDIDKSIDSFDMALRRRFVWKKYSCNYDVIIDRYSDEDNVETYIKLCKDINEYITSEKGLGLDDSYELGHSYFLKPKKLTKSEINKLWNEHISPLLKEYLRTQYSGKDIETRLNDMKTKLIDKYGNSNK